LSKSIFAQVEPEFLSDTAQKNILKKVEKIKDFDGKLRAIENLISSNKITNQNCLADLYNDRANVYLDIYGSDSLSNYDYISGDKSGSTIIRHVLMDYQTAIKTYPFHEPVYRADRLEFLNYLNSDHPLVSSDLAYLKQHGFKKEFEGFTPGANYMYGKSSWIGIELSPIGYVSPSFTLKNQDPADGKIKKVNKRELPVALAFATIGYNQLLKNSAHEFTISGFRLTAPIYLEITKFGFESGLNSPKLLWFYRPEIGIGNSFISVGYAYNVLFAKSQRSNWEKSLFVIKICYPILRYGWSD